MMNYTLEAEAREQHKKDTTAYMNSYNATGGGQYNPPPDMLPGDLFNTHPGHPSVITERPDIPPHAATYPIYQPRADLIPSNSISGFSRAPLEHVELEAINYTTQEHTATASITQEDAATAQTQPQPQPQLQTNSNTNSNRQKKKTTSAVEDCRMELMKNESKLRLEREGVLFEYEKQIKKAQLERELLLLQRTRTEMGLEPKPYDYS